MNHQTTTGLRWSPGRARPRRASRGARCRVGRHWSAVRSAATAALLVAGCLTGVTVSSLAVGTAPAFAGVVPPAPSGWTTVFGDNFAGSAGSAPSSANWFYDIGTGFGTGEIEHTTNS